VPSGLTPLLTGPASNLVSGLIGAIVGVVALFVVQGLQSRSARREAQSAARLIYLEIAYNIAAVQSYAAATTAVPLLVASGEWERHSQRLVAIMREEEIARVASPYIQLSAFRVVFAQKWYNMAVLRLKDGDLRVLKILFDAFRDAEAALRPSLWTGKRLEGLTAAGAPKGDPFKRRPLRGRLLLALTDVPVEFSSAVIVALLATQLALRVVASAERWLRDLQVPTPQNTLTN